MQKTYKFIIFSLLLAFGVLSVNAQVKKISADTVSKSWFRGLRIDLDLSPAVTTLLSNSETYSYQAAVQADIMHRYFPIVELGYAGADRIASNNIGFKTNGMFSKIGVDFSLMKQKKDAKPTNNLFLAGVRLGFSNFKYDLTNIVITDNYWNETKTLNYLNEPATIVWFEIVAGIRVEIIKNIYMGWTVRNKSNLGEKVMGEMTPWYIPGFGKNASSAWGVNYAIGYMF